MSTTLHRFHSNSRYPKLQIRLQVAKASPDSTLEACRPEKPKLSILEKLRLVFVPNPKP